MKKAYLVGSIYNDKTKPQQRNPKFIVYIPQHTCIETLKKKQIKFDPKTNKIPPLMFSPPTINELIKIAEGHNYYNLEVITSLSDVTDPELYKGHNFVKSNRFDFKNHFNKCRRLYECAAVIISDIRGTFDIIGYNYNIPILYRNSKENKINFEKNKYDSTPLGNCQQLTINALDEIYKNID